MLRILAAHLPRGPASAPDCIIAEHDGVQAVAPALDAAKLTDVCTALLDARAGLLRVPVGRVIRVIDAAARRLLDPAEPERVQVLQSLHAISGFSAAMAEHLLDRIVQDWLAPALEHLLKEELGGPDAVESFVLTGGGRQLRAVAPALGLHVFAGNVPGVGVTSIVRALLVRSAVIGKSAAGEPALAAAFGRLLSAVDPEIGRCVAVTYWRGGDTPLEDAVLARVGLVVHYGGGNAIAALRARASAQVRFVEHGPRISFALIDAASGDSVNDSAPQLARAVALFDQQGCVSPQLVYVIGNRDQAHQLAAATAAALAELQTVLPRGRITPGEAAAIRELRTRAEFGAIAGRGGDLWAPSELHYSVILSDVPSFEGTCLNRTLLVKHVPDVNTLIDLIAPFGDLLQTVGTAGFDAARLPAVAAALGDAGVTRVTTLAAMPWPPPAWHHDGRGPLRELIRWVDLEMYS
ncbi:MAG: acyl-CoA reductase [Longimicrobiales bacterium]